jgi:hypothetical protein
MAKSLANLYYQQYKDKEQQHISATLISQEKHMRYRSSTKNGERKSTMPFFYDALLPDRYSRMGRVEKDITLYSGYQIYTGDIYESQVQEVTQYGSKDKSLRSKEQTNSALAWA